VRSFNDGASLVSYIGHGGIHLWAGENIFNTDDVASSLIPQSQQPLVLTMNCLNGYFHFPYFDSLAEAVSRPTTRAPSPLFPPPG
jgi:hypothetical protein